MTYPVFVAKIPTETSAAAKLDLRRNATLVQFFGNPKLGIPAGRAMTGTTEMINGYIVIGFGETSELGPGGWYFYDASKLPLQMPAVKILKSTEQLREQNKICFRRDPNGNNYAATMAKAGIQFHDWTDAPRTTVQLNYLNHRCRAPCQPQGCESGSK